MTSAIGDWQSNMAPGSPTWRPRVQHGGQNSNMAHGSPTWRPGVQRGDRDWNMATGSPTWRPVLVGLSVALSEAVKSSPSAYQMVTCRLLCQQPLVELVTILFRIRRHHKILIVACWSPHRHVELAVAMLDSRSPCWTPGCHVGLPVAMLGSWLQCRGRPAAKTPDIFAFPAWRHMVCLPLRRKLRFALPPLGCISGHGFLC